MLVYSQHGDGMKVNFDNDEKLIMHLMTEDAIRGAKKTPLGANAVKEGKLLLRKIHFTNPTLNLKRYELYMLADFAEHTLKIIAGFEIPEDEKESQKEAREENEAAVRKLFNHIEEIFNDLQNK